MLRAQHVAHERDVKSILAKGFEIRGGYTWRFGPATYLGLDGDTESARFYASAGRDREAHCSVVLRGDLDCLKILEVKGDSEIELHTNWVKMLGGARKVAAWATHPDNDHGMAYRYDTVDQVKSEMNCSWNWDMGPYLAAMSKSLGYEAVLIRLSCWNGSIGGTQIVLFYPEKFRPTEAIPYSQYATMF